MRLLRRLLGFRHFLRHAYSVRLDGERLRGLRRDALSLGPHLSSDLDQLDVFLRRLAESADREASVRMDPQLRDAIGAGDVETVERLLDERPELAGGTEGGVSAVLFALYRGQEAIARQLLAARRRTADVLEAAALGEVGALAAALAADSEARDRHAADGFTPLCLAAFFGRVEAVALLLEEGANPNLAAADPSGVRPLHSAVAHRDRERSRAVAAALLDGGADPNVFQQGGWTPLHSAALHGDLDLVELLLRHGADPAAESDDGKTPAGLAREKGHARVVERLSS